MGPTWWAIYLQEIYSTRAYEHTSCCMSTKPELRLLRWLPGLWGRQCHRLEEMTDLFENVQFLKAKIAEHHDEETRNTLVTCLSGKLCNNNLFGVHQEASASPNFLSAYHYLSMIEVLLQFQRALAFMSNYEDAQARTHPPRVKPIPRLHPVWGRVYRCSLGLTMPCIYEKLVTTWNLWLKVWSNTIQHGPLGACNFQSEQTETT